MRRRFLLFALPCVASVAAAQGRTPIAEGVEVRILHAPTVATIDGRPVLAWEVHLTNARVDTVRVQRVVVRDGARRVIATFADSALERSIQPVSRGPSQAPAAVVPPGVRRVLHAWVTLASGEIPRQLVHEVTVTRAGGDVVTTSAPVLVERAPARLMSPPLRGGPWAAIYDPALPGGHRMAIYTVDGHARIPARFAMDFVRLPATGRFDLNDTTADRNGFGADVLAVGDGTIAFAVDDMPDNDNTGSAPRPRFAIEAGSGNYVALDLGGGRYAFYEHLKAGSVSVRPGQRVRAGQVIARLGYSGSSSIGPHLHFHLADASALLASEGQPFALRSFREMGAFRDIATLMRGGAFDPPSGGTPIARAREMPRPNAVVIFP